MTIPCQTIGRTELCIPNVGRFSDTPFKTPEIRVLILFQVFPETALWLLKHICG